MRGGLSEAFWFNPPVVEGSASLTPLRMRLACFEEWASARKVEEGSATCWTGLVEALGVPGYGWLVGQTMRCIPE